MTLTQNISMALIVVGFCITTSYSQSTVRCKLNTIKASQKIYSTKFVLQNVQQGYDDLKAEADKGCPRAQYMMGYLLYKCNYDYSLSENSIYRKISGVFIDHQNAFHYLSQAYEGGEPKAISYLGDIYRMGLGCRIDYDRALELYEEAFSKGDDKGAYEIGYCYLKGLGNIAQSYTDAIQWFEKSEHPMAKHWLAVCHYFGLGTVVNKEKALVLLEENDRILNSPTLLAHLETLYAELNEGVYSQEPSIEIVQQTEQVNEVINASAENVYSEQTVEELSIQEDIYGEWSGKLLDLDFAGEQIIRTFPITINFKKDDDTGGVSYIATIEGNANSGIAIPLDESLYFQRFDIELPKMFKEHPKITAEQLSIRTLDVSLKSINYIKYMIADVETYNTTDKEPGNPKLLVLTNSKITTDNGQELSRELLERLLAAQGDNFIDLYPNPFQSDLLIQYELTEESVTRVEIFGLDGIFHKVITDGETQPAGKKLYYFDGSHLKDDIYIVKVTANNIEHTKLIAKE